MKKEGRTHNITYTQVGVQCFYESEVLNPNSVLLMKFIAKNPYLCVAANRCSAFKETTWTQRTSLKNFS